MKRLVFVLSLIGLLVSSIEAQVPETVRAQIREGMQKFRSGDIKGSIAQFETAAVDHPAVVPELWGGSSSRCIER